MSIENPSRSNKQTSEGGLELQRAKKFDFSGGINFIEPKDGDIEILKREDVQITDEDIDRGTYTRSEKNRSWLSRNLAFLPEDLEKIGDGATPARRTLVERLRAGKPTFIPLNKDVVDEAFVTAGNAFAPDKVGIILVPITDKVILKLPAIESEGKISRLMRGAHKTQEEVAGLNLLSPHMEARDLDERIAAYTVEFVENGEEPRTISTEEMENWLDRVRQSRMVLNFDVGLDDPTLDNFLRKDGKLYWIDGDILKAKSATSEEELDASIGEQRRILSNYIKTTTL